MGLRLGGRLEVKRQSEEIACECGHCYHDHERVFDKAKRAFSFAHSGPCIKCGCKGFKDKDKGV